MKTIFGIDGLAITEYAIAANAIVGIRDSGKTYTATEASEELFEAGIPFVWLDPIGVAHNLRIPGKGRGYPVVVAGGKNGDLPLTTKSAGATLRAAMKSGISLVIDLFSVELSKADWRRIVRECAEILLHENGDHGLRHLFIEEAAEFVPQKPMDYDVFSAVEKLVRMGGNSKVGVTLINQRSADLNKSVLELCANVFVHRQKGKNTILDLKKWFTLLDLTDAEQDKIADSLPNLKSGECWALLNDVHKPVFVRIPEKNSLHPDRRAKSTAAEIAKRKPVPADAFVADMQSKLAKVIEEATANDPAVLKRRISELEREAKKGTTSAPVEKINTAAIERAARDGGYADGWNECWPVAYTAGAKALQKSVGQVAIAQADAAPPQKPPRAPKVPQGTSGYVERPASRAVPTRPVTPPTRRDAGKTNGHDELTSPQRRVLQSVAFWRSVGTETPSRAQVAGVAGYSPSSGGFNNLIGGLNTLGLITIPMPGRVALSDAAPFDPLSVDEARDKVLSVLSGPQRKIVDAVIAHVDDISRDDLGERTGYSPSSGGFNNLIGSLCTLTVLMKPAAGHVALSDWAREVLAG